MPLGAGALWWADRKWLIVSDLHFEKGSSYARRGQMLPPYDTSATLNLVESLVAAYQPETVISLGDSFHDPEAETRLDPLSIRRIRNLTAGADWIWVEGNHDPDPPQWLGGRASREVRAGRLVFRHEPTGALGEVAGHLHPVARIASSHRSVRRKCFVTDGHRLILPSLGTFTGGLNVLDPAFKPVFPEGGVAVFTLSRDDVIPVSSKRLVPDVRRPNGARWRL